MIQRRHTSLLVLSLLVLAPLSGVQAVDGPNFGKGHLPDGCTNAFKAGPSFNDTCYHMRIDLNDLDTPIIDVLLVPPVGPYAERELRVMRQVVEMWSEGIEYLAPQMGLDWMAPVEFNIFVDDQTFTTDPAWDPEIVVVLANPVVAGVQGIGIDPLGAQGPCRGANPLATFEAWEALPGFDSHHQGHSGTYVEECEGGGTTCYAVNLAIDPAPGVLNAVLDVNSFDLIAHEVGHCLSVGHVGDAGDHKARAVPFADIMSYDLTPRGGKCVSSLDVEGFAVRMSRYLLPVPLVANDANSPASGSFVVQHPRDHYYASSTGLSRDCPKPALGLVPPSEPVSFTPTGGAQRTPPTLEVASHADGDTVAAGPIALQGTVFYSSPPGASAASAPDAGDDGSSSAPLLPIDGGPLASHAHTQTFTDDASPPNTFYADDSSFFVRPTSRKFTLPLAEPSRVTLTLKWNGVDRVLDNLDLHVSGAAIASSVGFRTVVGEKIVLDRVQGTLNIRVDPVLITDPALGVTYTLTADITPLEDLVCPDNAPNPAPGCLRPAESVAVRVDGVEVASQVVDGRGGDDFALPVDLTGRSGDVELTVTWYERQWVVRQERLTLHVA